jgi:hypothetical protein
MDDTGKIDRAQTECRIGPISEFTGTYRSRFQFRLFIKTCLVCVANCMKFGSVYLEPCGEEPNTSANLQNVTDQRWSDRKYGL